MGKTIAEMTTAELKKHIEELEAAHKQTRKHLLALLRVLEDRDAKSS